MKRSPFCQSLRLAGWVLAVGCASTASQPVGPGGSGGTTGSGGATAPSDAAGSGGSGGSGSGGSDAAVPGSGGATLPVDAAPETSGTGGSGLPDPGTEGDGDRTIGPNYTRSPLVNAPAANVPKGRFANFTMQGTESQIYKGVNGNYQRAVRVYVPMQYTPGTAAPFMVTQDAMGQDVLPNALDNLISMQKLPKIVVFFVNNGGGDAMGSQRGLEYDTVSGLFAEFIDKEVLPRGIMEVKKQLNIDLTLTKDPEGRCTMGGSSGGAASFSMVWWHPDLFRRALTYSGTFVSQVPANSPFPHGCWVYHDVDPRFTAVTDPAHGLIVQHCEPAAGATGSSNPGPCDMPLDQTACLAVTGCAWNTKVNKPIRVWLESADRDLGTPGHELDPKYGPVEYRDFNLANQRMAAAMKARGYHYHYDFAQNAGHVDGNVVGQTLPEALLWVWRGYPID